MIYYVKLYLILFGASTRKGAFQLLNREHLVTEQNRGTLAQQGAGTGSNLDPGCFTVTLQWTAGSSFHNKTTAVPSVHTHTGWTHAHSDVDALYLLMQPESETQLQTIHTNNTDASSREDGNMNNCSQTASQMLLILFFHFLLAFNFKILSLLQLSG